MAKRAGRTIKLSVSIDQDDFALLKARAKRVSRGNISAAIADVIHVAREWEGRQALAAWLGEGKAEPSEAVMNAIRAEWTPPRRTRRRKRAA